MNRSIYIISKPCGPETCSIHVRKRRIFFLNFIRLDSFSSSVQLNMRHIRIFQSIFHFRQTVILINIFDLKVTNTAKSGMKGGLSGERLDLGREVIQYQYDVLYFQPVIGGPGVKVYIQRFRSTSLSHILLSVQYS